MWRWGVSLRLVTHMIVRGSHAETSSDTDRPTPAHLAHWRDTIRPARAARGHFRYKTLPAHPFSPHVRYKTLPAHPLSPHVRDKTLPARPKWPNLAQSTHAGRVLYRFGQHNTEQGEFCTERKAKIKRSDTRAHQAPCGGRRRVRGAWTRCRRPVRRANTGSRGQRQTNFAHNFPRSLFKTTQKRCNSNDTTSISKQVSGELRAKLLRRRQDHRQTNFAHNFPRSLFETTRKRCNSNDANSMFERAAGELRAKLMIDSHNWATYSNRGPGRGAGGRRRGLVGNTQTISTAQLEAAARPAGPGRTTSRRAELKARSADGERAGRRPPAHTAARPV